MIKEKDFFKVISDRFKTATKQAEIIIGKIAEEFANNVDRPIPPVHIDKLAFMTNRQSIKFYSKEDLEKMAGEKITNETIDILTQTRNKYRLYMCCVLGANYEPVYTVSIQFIEILPENRHTNKLFDSNVFHLGFGNFD